MERAKIMMSNKGMKKKQEEIDNAAKILLAGSTMVKNKR